VQYSDGGTTDETQRRRGGILEKRIKQFILKIFHQHSTGISLPQRRREITGKLI
jgi:hypothetical protein